MSQRELSGEVDVIDAEYEEARIDSVQISRGRRIFNGVLRWMIVYPIFLGAGLFSVMSLVHGHLSSMIVLLVVMLLCMVSFVRLTTPENRSAGLIRGCCLIMMFGALGVGIRIPSFGTAILSTVVIIASLILFMSTLSDQESTQSPPQSSPTVISPTKKPRMHWGELNEVRAALGLKTEDIAQIERNVEALSATDFAALRQRMVQWRAERSTSSGSSNSIFVENMPPKSTPANSVHVSSGWREGASAQPRKKSFWSHFWDGLTEPSSSYAATATAATPRYQEPPRAQPVQSTPTPKSSSNSYDPYYIAPEHLQALMATPDPTSGHTVNVRDRVGHVIGFVSRSDKYIFYKNDSGNTVAQKHLISDGHYDIQDRYGHTTFRK